MGLCDFSKIQGQAAARVAQFAQHAFNSLQVTQQSYLLAKIVLERKIPGDFVECGIAAGSQLAAMHVAVDEMDPTRTMHGYDSFDGIPMAGPEDDQQPGISGFLMDRDKPLRDRLISSNVSRCPLAEVQKLWTGRWAPFKAPIKFHKGWFQDTLPNCEIEKIAMLRLDGDLYESTLCCLDYLYDRVSPGGLIFIDDWGLAGCRKAVMEFLAKRDISPKFEQEVGIKDGGDSVYWFKEDQNAPADGADGAETTPGNS